MTIRAEWTPYGRPAAQALRSAIGEAKGGDPLAPVTVVVASNHVGVAARRLLASGALGPVVGAGVGLVAVTFLTPYRLAELIGAAPLAAAGRRPVSTPVLAAAVRAALAEDAGVFGAVREHPATESALVGAYRELRDLTPEALDAVAATSPRAGDVVRLHRAARRSLEAEWYDEEDLLAAAAHRLADGQVADVGALVVHLPGRLTRHAAALLRAAGERGEVRVLAGTSGDARADGEVARTVAALLPGVPPPPEAHPVAPAARIVTTSDADDEVRAAVRAVVDAAREGVPLDRMAVLFTSADPYARLVAEHLAAADLPVNGAAPAPVAASVAARALLGLLALPHDRLRRQDLFAWLAGAPVLVDGRAVPTAAWERLSREAGVVAGRAHWDGRLATHADQLEAEADDADAAAAADDEADRRAARARQGAAQARELRAFSTGLLDELAGAAEAPRPWSVHAGWAKALLARCLGGDDRRVGWPAAERTAAERVDLALDRLAALDAVEAAVPLEVFARTLEVELEADLGRQGRFGDGVLVGSLRMGVGLELDLVVVLGLAEGTFPTPVRDDALLPDAERAAAGGALALRRERVEAEHHELLAVLAGAAGCLLAVPRGDLRRSAGRTPSRWVLELAPSLRGGPVGPGRPVDVPGEPAVEHVPSFGAGLRTLATPATAQEHRLRRLLAADHPLAGGGDDDALAAGAAAVAARRSSRFTRFDGNLAGLPVPSPVATTTSPTRLEAWARCPFAYFLRHVLGVKELDDPEDVVQIDPLVEGRLVHAVLERFVLDALHEGPCALTAGRLRSVAEELCDEQERRGGTGRPVFWRRDRDRILADLERFLECDRRRLATVGARPVAAEWSFDSAPIELADGRTLRFRGTVDRVDVGADGGVHVTDYKTGSASGYAGLGEHDPDRRGTRLQLPVYAAAARERFGAGRQPVVAAYAFAGRKGEFKRVEVPLTETVVERVGSTFGTIVAGIEAGVFPAYSDTVSSSPFVTCPWCDPDALGVAELQRAWARKRHDPALAPFVALAEPSEEGADRACG